MKGNNLVAHDGIALLEREDGLGSASSFRPEENANSPTLEADELFRLSVFAVGVFVVHASNELAAWESLTQHGHEHPSMRIGRPLEMLPGFAVAEKVDQEGSAGIIGSTTYVRAETFHEHQTLVCTASVPTRKTPGNEQALLPLIHNPRKFRPGE